MNVSLRPDHSLLDPNFESYKLSLAKIPIYEANSEHVIYCKALNEVTSKQHLKAYNNINCLCINPFDTSRVYYMNTDGSLVSTRIPQCPQNFNQGTAVFTIPSWCELSREKLPSVSLKFPAPSYISLYDGLGNLYLLKSNILESGDSLDVFSIIQSPVHEKDSQLIDCVLIPNHTSHQIFLDCLFICVSEKSEDNPICNDSTSSYVTYLEWITYSSPESSMSWSVVRHQKLVSSSFPEFAAFEGDCSALHICSEKIFYPIYDSCNPSVHKNYLNTRSDSKPMNTGDMFFERKAKFSVTWTQRDAGKDINPDSLNIIVMLNDITLPSSYDSNVITVEIIPVCDESSKHQLLRVNLYSYILVTETEKVNDCPITLIDHVLYGLVKPTSLWTYNQESNCIEIHLNKQDCQYWPRLLLDSNQNEILTTMNYINHVGLDNQMDLQSNAKPDLTLKPPFNVGQLEEVDFPMSEDETDLTLQRLDHETLKCTHQAYLSGHQWLFKIYCSNWGSSATHAFCIRHDVDGIVWLPLCQSNLTNIKSGKDQCTWKHVSTLQAFGYVLASKRESRFVSCPVLSDGCSLKFVAVADYTRRIYVYRQPLPNDSKDTELRKRITVNSLERQQIVHVASQHVITLPTNEPITGFVATDEPYPSILVCTQSTLYLLPLDG
ncbi:NudC domain-containing protein [Schistosoma japonicum]|uniref:NudC domain-containing protein 1 n=2 Tax=Schistosoma japonicum TaxID=6182 RepID=A0A4Z2CS73_SCHJA|nr:NudC domain-containing protein 1 [Schistosoma japonicum]TNN07121.1 NudC domain-containing protein [Schistosoma japonicum]TNN07122.1 NudC domain-containing protein [Schistosoma japonicum]